MNRSSRQAHDPLELLLFFILPLPHYTQQTPHPLPPLPSLVLSAAAVRSVSSLPDCAAVVKQRGKRERDRNRKKADSGLVVEDWIEQ